VGGFRENLGYRYLVEYQIAPFLGAKVLQKLRRLDIEELHTVLRAKPDITLRTYAHLFRKDDGKAAAAINAVMGQKS
jgi:hypothetical protein